MLWHEVPNFLQSLPTDRVFITQTDSSQKVTVQFGDGIEGERTPTGQMNIRAVYRKGIGSGGNVHSGQLTQALDRPQGLKSVTNPGPGTGGADPDTAADARTSAPSERFDSGPRGVARGLSELRARLRRDCSRRSPPGLGRAAREVSS